MISSAHTLVRQDVAEIYVVQIEDNKDDEEVDLSATDVFPSTEAAMAVPLTGTSAADGLVSL